MVSAHSSAPRRALAHMSLAQRAHVLKRVNTCNKILLSTAQALLGVRGFAAPSGKGRFRATSTLAGDLVPFAAGKAAVFPGDCHIVRDALEACWPELSAAGCPERPAVIDLTFSVLYKRSLGITTASWALNAVWPVLGPSGATLYRIYNRNNNRELVSAEAADTPESADHSEDGGGEPQEDDAEAHDSEIAAPDTVDATATGELDSLPPQLQLPPHLLHHPAASSAVPPAPEAAAAAPTTSASGEYFQQQALVSAASWADDDDSSLDHLLSFLDTGFGEATGGDDWLQQLGSSGLPSTRLGAGSGAGLLPLVEDIMTEAEWRGFEHALEEAA